MSTAPATLLCVHPHPDDESIACGGVLARAADNGVRTVVVTCTGGEEGDNLAGIDLGGQDLASHRRRELTDALAALEVHRHHYLGYRDSGMVGTPGNDHPDSFHRAELDQAALRLAAVIRSERPQVVVADDVTGTYGHPDHIKAHAVTRRAVDLAADPAAPLPGSPWQVAKRYSHTLSRGRLEAVHRALLAAGLASPFGADLELPDIPLGTPDAAVTTVVDVGPWLPRKQAALAAHRSQIGADSFFLNTPAELAGQVFATEEFVLEAGPRGPGPAPEPDLFHGLPAATPGGSASLADPAITPAAFRATMGSFLTGVAIMTTHLDGVPHGMTANAISSVSLDPPLVLVCVDRSAHMAEMVTRSGVFALSFLAVDQAGVSDRFADPSRPLGVEEFLGVPTSTRVTGAPVLAGATAHVDCRVDTITPAGDHLVVIGEVLDLAAGAADPLAYLRGGYGTWTPAPTGTASAGGADGTP